MPFKTDNEVKAPCDACLKGKQSRNSFPEEKGTRATELLEIIHSDVFGPMKSRSLGGNAYFVTFIGDWSKFTKEINVKSSINSRNLRQWPPI